MARVTAVYAVAVLAGALWLLLGPQTPWRWFDTLVADLLATLVVFSGSRALGNSSVYDAYWSLAPPLLVLAWWLDRDPGSDPVRAVLFAGVLLAWAVRLTAHWVRGWSGLDHEDWRYPLLRDGAGRFGVVVDLVAIHVIPTVQVFVALLPAYLLTTGAPSSHPLAILVLAVGLLVGLVAVTLETVADEQMRRFVAARTPGAVMDAGLWAWSRHPNYLGEWLWWLSVALVGLGAAPGQWWWALPGPAVMLAMFAFASIPMMDRRSLERRPAYAEVVARVPAFFPRRPRA
ncbi:DUF1295 domain-containing protein [Nocardioides sp. CBS4Y-1]|uniref:DUF1295 domain-containing protein n=1 Tax=Nocardioides acrostichi TaxID=2784339 RepID=A0A930Y6D2_9ACTN|nr:DUF1295 domain-containing protein [Nocardioides acrostichi]